MSKQQSRLQGWSLTFVILALVFAAALSATIALAALPANSTASTLSQAHTPQGAGQWQTVAHLPMPLYGAGIASDGTNVYIAGGANGGGIPQNTFTLFDPTTLMVIPLPPMPVAVEGASVLYDLGKIYVVTGLNGNLITLADVQVYNLTNSTWADTNSFPQPQWQSTAFSDADGSFVTIGGSDTFAVHPQTDVIRCTFSPFLCDYDTSLPYGIQGGVGDRDSHGISTKGGRTESQVNISTTLYLPAIGGAWTAGPNMLAPTNEPGEAHQEIFLNGVTTAGQEWVFGGGNPFYQTDQPRTDQVTNAFLAPLGLGQKRLPPGMSPLTTNVTQIYDPVANNWSYGPTLNVGRSFIAGGYAAGYMVAAGGWTGSAASDVIETAYVGGGGTPTPTATPGGAASPTPTRTSTRPPSQTPGGPTATPSPCTIEFADVGPTNPFYSFIRCLVCRGIVGGYTTSPPCPAGQTPCFLPGNNVTRGQMAKFISGAANYQDVISSTQQTFTDVAHSNPFWLYVERVALHGVVGGYTTSPPCTTGTPCFLPGNNVTRGQAAKFVSIAKGYADIIPSTQQTFTDVAPSTTFWLYIERVALHGVVGGYTTSPPCTTGTPCFLPANNVSRGQTSKFISNAFFPNCQTPIRP